MRIFIALSLLVFTLVLAGVSAQAEGVQPTINVTGTGQITLPPDMATVVVGIQTESEESGGALDQASAATLAILERLSAEGISSSDIKSGAVRLQPRYSSSVLSTGQQIVGYRAVNTVEVAVLDLSALGGLLSALVGDGANRLDRVTFGLQDPSAAQDEARYLAVAEAIRRAHLYADAADVVVGDVLNISEQGNVGYRGLTAEPAVMIEMAQSAPSLDVPVAAGEIMLNASINMVFEISE